MKINPYLEIFLATLIWGINGVFIKLIQLPFHVLTIIRLLVPMIILIIYFSITKKNILKKCNKTLVLISFLNIIRLILYYISFIYTSVANAVILIFTWPIFAAILAPWILKEKTETKTYFLFLMAFLGIIIINLKTTFIWGDKDFIGIVAAVFSAFLTALSIVVFKKESEHVDHWESVFFLNMFGALAALPFIWVIPIYASNMQIILTIIYAFLVGFLGFALFFSGLKKVHSTHASLLAYLEMVNTIILGVLILSEELTWNMLAGGALIVLAGILLKKKVPVEPVA